MASIPGRSALGGGGWGVLHSLLSQAEVEALAAALEAQALGSSSEVGVSFSLRHNLQVWLWAASAYPLWRHPELSFAPFCRS